MIQHKAMKQYNATKCKKLLKHRIVLTQIDNEEEIPNKVIELLERYKFETKK